MSVIYEDDQVRVVREVNVLAGTVTTRMEPKTGTRDFNRDDLLAKAATAIAELEQNIQNWPTMLAAQRQEATLHCLRVTRALARLVADRLESA